MANLYDAMFIIALIMCAGITIAKIYNLMGVGTFYHIKIGFLLFAGYGLGYGLSFITTLLDSGDELMYSLVFSVLSLLLIVNVVLMFIEVIFYLRETSLGPTKAHNAQGVRNARK